MHSSLYKAENIQSSNTASGVDDSTESAAAVQKTETGVVVPINGEPADSAENVAASDISTYGSFSLAGSEFALSAKSIQEVVNEPAAYSPIPLAPDYLVGVFNLRGSIVPVIDLRKIFKLDDALEQTVDLKKVAIIEYGDLCLGLLFDSTGEVFNSTDVEHCLFESRGPSTSEQVIAGVFKMDDGRRIVQILDVQGILKLDKVPQSKSQGVNRHRKNRGKRRQCISFRLGPSCCALDISAIREIVNIGQIENTVLAGDMCLGAIDIRGDTVPIVNFSLLFGYGGTQPETLCESDPHRVIVMNVQDNLIGLLVDSIRSIVSYYDDELIDFPILVDKKKNMFQGCVPAASDSEHTIVLKHTELLSGEELAQITRGHSQLFNDSKENVIRERKGSLDRKTLITFSLEQRYGMDIRDVKEVIDYPENLIKTPNMAEHIKGMANLRGELIAVIDSRKLYSMKSAPDNTAGKVLVYEKAGIKQGLVVDSVDSIIPFSRADVVNVPEIVFRAYEGDMGKDVQEAIMIKTASRDETVCILDLEAVSRRASA